jgi:peptide/nickel transport system substrate-binding protein
LVSVPDVTARAQAVLSRQVDIALDVAIEDESAITNSGGRIAALPMGQVEVIQFVTVKPSPLRDKKVRVALNLAVDKARIAKEILHGHAISATQYISHEVFGYDPAVSEPFPFDREKARALLAEAGYTNGFDLPIEVLNTVNSAAYEQIAADLRAVGIRVTLSRIPIEIYARNYTGGDWGGLAFHSLYNTAPPMDALRPLRVHSCLRPKPWHCDQAVAEQISRTQEEFNGQARLLGIREILRKLLDNPPGILLYEGSTLVALGPRVNSFAAPLGFIRYDLLDAGT